MGIRIRLPAKLPSYENGPTQLSYTLSIECGIIYFLPVQRFLIQRNRTMSQHLPGNDLSGTDGSLVDEVAAREWVRWVVEPQARLIVDGLCLAFVASYFHYLFRDAMHGGSMLAYLAGITVYLWGVIGVHGVSSEKSRGLLRALAGNSLLVVQFVRFHSFDTWPAIGLIYLGTALCVMAWGAYEYGLAKKLHVAIIVICTISPVIGLFIEMCLPDYSKDRNKCPGHEDPKFLSWLLLPTVLQCALSIGCCIGGGVLLVVYWDMPDDWRNEFTMRAFGFGGAIGLAIGRAVFFSLRL